ncbi:MAG: hypothetical protein K6G16_01530 [Lachnospiraceae bacterium]|nr:hypothetical protein [Lachnospiraceae bacterium]
MRESSRKTESISRVVVRWTAAILLWALLPFSVSAAEEEFPEGMTESEKALMLQEMQQDIEADAPAYVDPASPADELSDEEARDLIKNSLPSQEEMERLAESYTDRVMTLADFKTGYDVSRGLYHYILPGGKGIRMSTPMGGWSDHAVSLVPDDGVTFISVVKDGEVVEETPGEDGAYFFRKPGHYAFVGYEETGDSTDYLSGSFRIVDPTEPVTDVMIWAPEGYRVDEALLNGSPAGFGQKDARWLELTDDGRYEVTFTAKNLSTGIPESFSVMFSRDTTPPVLEWEGEIHDGLFVGEVRFGVPEPDTEVAIWYNGQPAVSPTRVLAAAGSYYITATDRAGNVRTYNFVLERQGQIPWAFVWIAAGVLVLAGFLLVITAGRGMRIR